MLPSQYMPSTSAQAQQRTRPSSTRRGEQQEVNVQIPPPIGITGVLCVNRTLEIPGRGTLHYTIYRPRMLLPATANQAAPPVARPAVAPLLPQQPNPPLLCVAGGPGMPCQYLSSLVHLVPDRAVILYDHMGCGQSIAASAASSGDDNNNTSFLENTVNDLAKLIQHALPSEHTTFHLFGHSLGGVICFEYFKSQQLKKKATEMMPRCLSVVLASAPLSIAASRASSKALLHGIVQELLANNGGGASSEFCSSASRMEDNNNDDNDDDAALVVRAAHGEFQRRHECRVSPMPLTLQQSLTGLNNDVITEKQNDELQRYTASITDLDDDEAALSSSSSALFPPALVLRGQYDFVTDENARGWTDLFVHNSQYVTIGNCSHYGMCENEDLFGSVLTAFLRDHDK